MYYFRAFNPALSPPTENQFEFVPISLATMMIRSDDVFAWLPHQRTAPQSRVAPPVSLMPLAQWSGVGSLLRRPHAAPVRRLRSSHDEKAKPRN